MNLQTEGGTFTEVNKANEDNYFRWLEPSVSPHLAGDAVAAP